MFMRLLEVLASAVGIAILAACSSSPSTNESSLVQAVAFADGVSDVPDTHGLFVEYWRHESREGNCKWPMIDSPDYDFADGRTYEFANGQLIGHQIDSLSNHSGVVVGVGQSLSGTAGTASANSLKAVDALPYQINVSSPRIVLRAADDNGAIVVELDGKLFWIHPGGYWESTDVKQDSFLSDCKRVVTDTVTDIGLLRKEDVNVRYFDGVVDRPFQPGVTEPTPSPIPCTVEHPLGTEGSVWDIAIGQDGVVWVVTNSGVARLEPGSKTWKVPGDLPTGSIHFVTPDTDGTAWLAFGSGLAVYYFDGKQWTQFTGTDNMQADSVFDIIVAPGDSLWFATNNGVYQWNRKADTWTHFTEADGLHSNGIATVLAAPDGKIWFSSVGGVSYFDPAKLATGAQTWSRRDQPHTDGYDVATTSRDGKVWFGGQRYFDPTTQNWIETVYGGFAYDIAVDERGGLWLATEKGAIYIPDPDLTQPEEWQRYTIDNGLGGNSIRSLAIGDDGVVWFGAENGAVSRCTFTH